MNILLALSYFGYGRLVDEQVVSQIEFSKSAPGENQSAPGSNKDFGIM